MQKDININTHNFDRNHYERFVLVVDVGGNHTYAAIMGIKNNKEFEIIFKNSILTKDIETISIFINDCLKDAHEHYGIETDTACIGVAGPVHSIDRKSITLSHWDITIKVDDILLCTLIKKVILLNDFEAVGYGIDFMHHEKDMVAISHKNHELPKIKQDTTACVLGAGYGLGSCILPYDRITKLHEPIPCEAGHIDFISETDWDLEFRKFLQEHIVKSKLTLPDAERFVSGRGLIDLWHFVRGHHKNSDTEIANKIDFMVSDEKINSIFINYYNDSDCQNVVDTFIRYYAQFARMLAMTTVCFGGLYIVGGIAKRHVELFMQGKFMKEFQKSDKKEDILGKIPVHIVTNPDIGLYGCCNVAINFHDSI